MTVPESPCYLCQQRALGCHSKCPQYIAFARYRQAEAAERHHAVMQKVYDHDRYYRILRRCR
jgi:hypothetical protein